jgi:hypothetical protein
MLAKEWVCTKLAAAMSQSTFAVALMKLDATDVGQLRALGVDAQAGSAIAIEWDQSVRFLVEVVRAGGPLDVQSVADLIVFDTWVANHDRYEARSDATKQNHRNFLVRPHRIWAQLNAPMLFDFTEAFNGPSRLRDIAGIQWTKSQRVLSLLPERSFLGDVTKIQIDDALARLRSNCGPIIDGTLASVPADWGLTPNERRAVADYLRERLNFLSSQSLIWDRVHACQQMIEPC